MRHSQHSSTSSTHTSTRIFMASLLAVAIAGCSTVQVSGPPAPGAVSETPREEAQRSGHWQFDAGSRAAPDRDGYQPPKKLAVLLPLTGSLATAAQPVRDGFLAGYYSERRARPALQFYDTAGGAAAAYQKAIADGADQIVGPLGRDEVDAVFRSVQPGVLLLALNRGSVAPPVDAASYSLAPEDDGVSAADYLVSRKALKVIVLGAMDDYARRSVDAFGKQLAVGGGRVVQTLSVVGDKPADMTIALQQAVQREGGIDGVFLAMRSPQARAIAPQLAAAGLSAAPRVATSQLASGTGKAEQDRALDGIAFPSETSNASAANLPNVAVASSALPTARGPAARLFAFGIDAWLLSAYLPHLATSADANAQGATGQLRIGPLGNVLRAPAWSTFNGGYVVPMAGAGG